MLPNKLSLPNHWFLKGLLILCRIVYLLIFLWAAWIFLKALWLLLVALGIFFLDNLLLSLVKGGEERWTKRRTKRTKEQIEADKKWKTTINDQHPREDWYQYSERLRIKSLEKKDRELMDKRIEENVEREIW